MFGGGFKNNYKSLNNKQPWKPNETYKFNAQFLVGNGMKNSWASQWSLDNWTNEWWVVWIWRELQRTFEQIGIEVLKVQKNFNDHLFNNGGSWSSRKFQQPQMTIEVLRKHVDVACTRNKSSKHNWWFDKWHLVDPKP